MNRAPAASLNWWVSINYVNELQLKSLLVGNSLMMSRRLRGSLVGSSIRYSQHACFRVCVCVCACIRACVCVKGGFILSFISLQPRPAYLLTTTHIDSHTQIFSCLAKDKVMWVCVCVFVRWVQLSASFLWPPLLGVCACWTEGGHEDFTLISSLMKRLRVGVGVLRERNAGRWSTFHCQLQWSSVCVNKTDSESSNKKTFFGVFCWKFLTLVTEFLSVRACWEVW